MKGETRATWPPTWATPPPGRARTAARLRSAGLAQAKTGDQIFTAAGCAGCHTFGPAGSNGTIGPSLDELKTQAGKHRAGQDRRGVRPRVDRGPRRLHRQGLRRNAMPQFKGKLTDKQIQALVEYLLQQGGG